MERGQGRHIGSLWKRIWALKRLRKWIEIEAYHQLSVLITDKKNLVIYRIMKVLRKRDEDSGCLGKEKRTHYHSHTQSRVSRK